MNRRLNPDLFGPKSATDDLADQSHSAVATRQLQTELKQTKKRISHLESLIEVMQLQLTQQGEQTSQRSDAFSKAISELEKDFRNHSLEQKRYKQHIEERMNDQRIKDQQMEAMIERYNNTLQNFENRLSVVQKVISEKEMSLMTYRNIIEKIVDELETLKSQVRQPRTNRLTL